MAHFTLSSSSLAGSPSNSASFLVAKTTAVQWSSLLLIDDPETMDAIGITFISCLGSISVNSERYWIHSNKNIFSQLNHNRNISIFCAQQGMKKDHFPFLQISSLQSIHSVILPLFHYCLNPLLHFHFLNLSICLQKDDISISLLSSICNLFYVPSPSSIPQDSSWLTRAYSSNLDSNLYRLLK